VTAPTSAPYAIHPLPELAPGELLQHYEGLTFPPIERRLALRAPARPWAAAVALGGAGPVGLAVVEPAPEPGGTAQLLSLRVLPGHRRRGLGRALLAGAEDLAAAAGSGVLEGSYRTSWRSRAAVEALIAARGWSPPETRLLLARGETATARPLIARPAPPLPPEAELFGWEELAPAEREDLLASQRGDPWFPAILTPFQDEPRLEPGMSVGLRWNGRVAGWLTMHRVAFDTVQYSTFFLRSDLRRLGLARPIIREVVRRRLADPDVRYGIVAIDPANRRMRDLVDGPLRAHLPERSELRVARRRLD